MHIRYRMYKQKEEKRRKTNELHYLPPSLCSWWRGGLHEKKEAINCGAKGDPGIALHEETGATGKRTNMAALVSLSLCLSFFLIMLVSFFSILSLVTPGTN